jgi:hypothetical protein
MKSMAKFWCYPEMSILFAAGCRQVRVAMVEKFGIGLWLAPTTFLLIDFASKKQPVVEGLPIVG